MVFLVVFLGEGVLGWDCWMITGIVDGLLVLDRVILWFVVWSSLES